MPTSPVRGRASGPEEALRERAGRPSPSPPPQPGLGAGVGVAPGPALLRGPWQRLPARPPPPPAPRSGSPSNREKLSREQNAAARR